MHAIRSWAAIVLATGLGAAAVRADDWPGWLGAKRDGVIREAGIAAKFPAKGPAIRWRTPVSEGYSGPAIADGKVFVTDRVLAKGAASPANPFDKNAKVAGQERLQCLDEATGKVLWTDAYERTYQISYPAGPRTTPVIDQGKVYTLGAMGDLRCLAVADGKLLWSKKLTDEFNAPVPLWGFAGQPLIDGDKLICLVGGKGSLIVAFDKHTGAELWRALTARDPGYAPPMIFDIAGKRRLIQWYPSGISSIDPKDGHVFWTVPYGNRKGNKAGLSVPTPRVDGNRLLLTAFYEGALMLELHGDEPPTVLWQGKGRSEQPEDTDTLHSIMPTPTIRDGYIYGVCSYGELRCLKEATGQRVWQSYAPTTGESVRWGNAFLDPIGDAGNRYILFNERGDLILADLTPEGYKEASRAHILEPTNTMASPAGRRVVWSHPAYANRCAFVRNDREIVCVSLAGD